MLPLPPILVSSDIKRSRNEPLISTPFIDLKPQDFIQDRLEGENGRKRTRTLMSPFQTRVLRKVLQKTAFPSVTLRNNLSKLLGVPSRTIQIWFQNQRQKARQQRQSNAEPLDVLASVASKTQTTQTNWREQIPYEKAPNEHLRPWQWMMMMIYPGKLSRKVDFPFVCLSFNDDCY